MSVLAKESWVEKCQEVVEGTNTTTTLLAEPSTAGEDPSVVLDLHQATGLVLLCLIGLDVLGAEGTSEQVGLLAIENDLLHLLFSKHLQILNDYLKIF